MRDIKSCLKPGERVFIAGAGGVSMAPLARYLFDMGLTVSGCDRSSSPVTEELKTLGMDIAEGESPGMLKDASFVIRTAAIGDQSPVIKEAVSRNIPVFERAEAWGCLMEAYKASVCVSGVHGKTSTTGMIAHIALAAGLDPTIMIGGHLGIIGGGYRKGKGRLIILEACEYKNSFLHFAPTLGLILNVETDHLDFFKDLDDITASFRKFANNCQSVIYNESNPGAVNASKGLSVPARGFLKAENKKEEGMKTSFDISNGSELYAKVTLSVPGGHNVSNALAAASAAYELGIDGKYVSEGLNSFPGVARRMEYKGSFKNIPVYDDYAHHPTEIEAALKSMSPLGRIICVFQSHTYSRTYALFDDFSKALSIAHKAYIADIYAAREENIYGVSGEALAESIKNAEYGSSFEELAEMVKAYAEPGDIIITMGAGDIYKVCDFLV